MYKACAAAIHRGDTITSRLRVAPSLSYQVIVYIDSIKEPGHVQLLTVVRPFLIEPSETR